MSNNVFRYFKKILIVTVLFTSGLWSLSAQITVISPAKGVLANYQSLVLNVPAEYEAYYSLSEEEPLIFSFAYDEPVLLNVDGDAQVETGSSSSSSFDLTACSPEIVDSGLPVQTSVNGVGITADDSVVLAVNLRLVIMAETAVGMSFIKTVSLITGSTFTILGQQWRGIEFTGSQFSLMNSASKIKLM